jgi:hypothetical protein
MTKIIGKVNLKTIKEKKILIGFPLSGVVYFSTITFFTVLTWVTIASLLVYYHEDIRRYQFTIRHILHICDLFFGSSILRLSGFSSGKLYSTVKTAHERYSLARLSNTA